MAERLKDNEDLALEALLRPEPIADDGFSVRVVQRVRRRIWLRRVTLPFAVFLGSAIAAKPVAAFLGNLGELMGTLPGIAELPLEGLPSAYMLVGGGLLLALAMLGLNVLED